MIQDKKCKVVLLPAKVEKPYFTLGQIVKYTKENDFSKQKIGDYSVSKNASEGVLQYYEPYFMYIISDDEQETIATNNPNLKYPRIPNDFLVEYCKTLVTDITVKWRYEPSKTIGITGDFTSREINQPILTNNTIIINPIIKDWDDIFNHPTVLKLSSQEALKIWLKDNCNTPTFK